MEELNGWYYIKTWERMENEYGLDKRSFDIKCQHSFTKEMENELPPTRCIEITNGKWIGYSISDDMIETKAFKIGSRCLFRDKEIEKGEGIYLGYNYGLCFPHAAKTLWGNESFKYCEEIPEETKKDKLINDLNEKKEKLREEMEELTRRIKEL